jgi:outer membrane receptor protein involved in Fe transport
MRVKKVLVSVFLMAGMSLAAQETAKEKTKEKAQETTHETEQVLNLEEVVVTTQGREEKMLEVPITMSTVSGDLLELTNTTNLTDLSDFVPGLHIRVQTPNRPTFVIRGLTSDEVSPTAQPRVSTYFNNAPISRATMAKSNLYDMERVEVIKGPQGTLFGRGSQIGGINFITRKPAPSFGGYVGAGMGNYGLKEAEGAINIPIIADKLMIRTGGQYIYRDGTVENLTEGKSIGDGHSTNARFSLRYLPASNFRIDLLVDYQNDKDDGRAYINRKFGGDPLSLKITLPKGSDYYNKRNLFGTMLDMNYYFNNGNYISSLTAYHDNLSDSRWDVLGTIAPAMDMTDKVTANQFTQELRYNFTQGRLKGFAGGSFWRENVEQNYGFFPNEQLFVYILMDNFPGMAGMANNMIVNGQPNPMPALPSQFTGMPYDLPLPGQGEREEMKVNTAVNTYYDLFADLSYNLTDQLVFTAGLRGTWEFITMTDEVKPVPGSAPSTLGMLVYQKPVDNFLYAVSPFQEVKKDYFSTTWRANLKYLIDDRSNIFAGYSRGRRPPVLQPDRDGNVGEVLAETVDNFEIGFKYMKPGRFWFDAGLFYFLYNNFQAYYFENMDYKTVNAGKATSYGAELNANVTTFDFLDVFGNYSYIKARFNDDPVNQIFAGNRFRLTPDHSFTLGLNVKAKITDNFGIVFTPSYSYKSDMWFSDENVDELSQDAYGLLNLNLTFKLHKPTLNLSLYCHNLTDERYLIGGGNSGNMFGAPTFIPGLPRMFGAKAMWKF